MRTIFTAVLMACLIMPFTAQAQVTTPVTPRACPNAITTVGASAVAAITTNAAGGTINGGFIYNPPTATAQGIGSAENLFIDITGNSPTNAESAANGTVADIAPGQSFPLPLPPLKSGVTVMVNASTNGHKFSETCW
jgi:hypothetical protein